jgi:CBS domain-containing protein
MQVRDVMTSRVITVHPDTSVEDIARRLLEHGISAVPVTEKDGTLVGIVSEGDLMRRSELGTDRRPSWWLNLLLETEERAARYAKTHGRLARDVMTSPVITVDEDTDLAEVAQLLEKRRVKRLPVLRDGKLVGIVSRANLLQGLAVHRTGKPVDASDRVIRNSILSALRKDAGVRDELVNVTVSGGVVHLWGAVPSEQELKALRVVVENTEGVRDVQNNVGILPPQIRGV